MVSLPASLSDAPLAADGGVLCPYVGKPDVITEENASPGEEARQLNQACQFCGAGVPRYTFLRSNFYVNRPRNHVMEEDVFECMCDEGSPCGEGCMNREIFYECLPDECKVPGCCNQRFRQRQYAPLEVFHTPGKGYGLRCARALAAGEFLVEYVGEVCDTDEFQVPCHISPRWAPATCGSSLCVVLT